MLSVIDSLENSFRDIFPPFIRISLLRGYMSAEVNVHVYNSNSKMTFHIVIPEVNLVNDVRSVRRMIIEEVKKKFLTEWHKRKYEVMG